MGEIQLRTKICSSLLADKDLSPEKLAMLKEPLEISNQGTPKSSVTSSARCGRKMRQGMNYREIATASEELLKLLIMQCKD